MNRQQAIKKIEEIEKELPILKAAINSKRTENIMEDVKSFEDALAIYKETKHLSKERQTLLDYKGNDEEVLSDQAWVQINIIREVLNHGWKPNWKDSNELKYYPWFNMTSGSGLSYDGCVRTLAFTAVGSRLCFKSSELAEYAGKQFINIYEKIFIIS